MSANTHAESNDPEKNKARSDGTQEGMRNQMAAKKSHEAKYGDELLVLRHRALGVWAKQERCSLNDLEIPNEMSGRHLGSVFFPLMKFLVHVGRVKNNRPRANARKIDELAVKDPFGIRQWGIDNPLSGNLAVTPADDAATYSPSAVADDDVSGTPRTHSLFDDEEPQP